MRNAADVLYNFHWVVPGEAARMAQAHFGGLAPILKRHGLRAMINLRGRNPDIGWWRREREACASIGAQHFDVTLDSRKLPTRAMLTALFDAFDAAPRPLVVKCSGGQDRTSLASALYILQRAGWQAIDAAEMQFARWPYLHLPKEHQRWLKPFIAFAQEDAAGLPVAQWAREKYDPATLADWLDAHGMAGFYAQVFEKPTRSKWQWKW
ncbi:MAG TPA: hypothetical protein VHL34_16315 [Rhizomicrobium sp.]|jgi:hypothetical protein|nr:hypothetical protein [Rhizomicrobium sp.]